MQAATTLKTDRLLGFQRVLGLWALFAALAAGAQTGTPLQSVTRVQQQAPANGAPTADAASGPQAERDNRQRPPPAVEAPAKEPEPEPGEFERLVAQSNGGVPVARLGASARRSTGLLAERETPARVPPNYVIQVGDEVTVSVWGSVDAQWVLRVDRAGRLTLPRVGPVPLAGETVAGLEDRLRARLLTVFKGFELAAAVTDVSPVKVHITGFVERPGDVVVPGLTTVSGALALVRGPAAGGSFRRILLVRDERVVVSFDLYKQLRQGKRSDDLLLQPGDVIFVDAAGPQAAVLGSVNRPTIIEFLPGETVADLLSLAGGFAPLADRGAVLLEPVAQRREKGALQLPMPDGAGRALSDGDVLRVRSLAATAGSNQLRNKRVLVEGEVGSPGEYLLPPLATLVDALRAAGGTTQGAYLFGAQLIRGSVRAQQEVNYERALRELETEVVRASTDRASRTEDLTDLSGQAQQLLARLRGKRPDGRIVLDLGPDARDLPPLELEDGDRLVIPTRNLGVGVFGSVYSAGSFALAPQQDLGYFIRRAGGPTASADYRAAFVVRANGSVLSAQQDVGLWTRKGTFEAQPALPGDTVFVPEEVFRGRFVQGARDWTQILYQLGVGLAAFRTF